MKQFLIDTLKNKFNSGSFKKFSLEFFNDLAINEKILEINPFFRDHIDELKLIGKYKDSDGKQLHILEVKLKTDSKLEHARTTQRNIIAKHLKDYWLDGALVAFYTPSSSSWRLSFVKIEYKFDKKGKTKEELTPPKRFSFLVGEKEPTHTAQQQLLPLVEETNYNPTLTQIEDAFGVEKVTKEFFSQYKALFEMLVKELNRNQTFKNEASKSNIKTENFAKKLLGQIVFLYFLQKKGWLGVESGKLWGDGNKSFLSDLFKDSQKESKNFFNDYLEVLFYDTLNNPRRNTTDPSYSKYFKCRIPFLNGGLFEPEYDWEGSFIYLDNEIFEKILNVFDLYNFTVKEDEPLEKEVAVDPEMLGKVFENLLEENLRKGKGTYYTPREIVHYMCQESLINYLDTNSSIGRKKAEEYVKFLRGDEKKQKAIAAFEGEAVELDNLLTNIKVADPACGSGAFLVGMMNEIVRLRTILRLLHPKKLEQKKEYELKKETIQNCIYGVDIDPGAIEIAQLRLWLSLVVDYDLEDIEPLPNLDYKIMQGNSLLEEFEGINFYGEDKKQEGLFVDKARIKKKEELRNKKLKYFSISNDEEKTKLRKEINNLIDWFVKSSLEKAKKNIIKLKKKEEAKQELLKGKARKKYWEQWSEKFLLEGKIDDLLKKIHNPKMEKPFFLWKLNFMEVFEFNGKNGFDVVIANPPYIEHKKLKSISGLLRGKFKVYSGTADLYVYFFEVALNILREKGTLTFISSNKFIRARYGFPLRALLAINRIYNIVDFTRVRIFDALVASCIILVSKNTPVESVLVTFADDTFTSNLADYIKDNHITVPSASLGGDMWQLEDDTKLKIKERIESGSKKLKVVKGVNIFRGVTTGYNPAFVIDDNKRIELIEKKSNKEIIKPLLQGRNIKKWTYNYVNEYLLFIPWHFPLHLDQTISGASKKAEKTFKVNYRTLYNHLRNFKKELLNRNKDETGIRYEWYTLQRCAASYYSEFEKEKIIWGLTSDKWTFAYDKDRHYLPSNGYILTSSEIPIKYLLALINSKLMKFYFGFIGIMTAGGAYTLKHETIAEFPIKELSKPKKQPFIDLVNKILVTTTNDDYLVNTTKQAQVREYEKRIDALVYKLYGLTEGEIKIVEKQ